MTLVARTCLTSGWFGGSDHSFDRRRTPTYQPPWSGRIGAAGHDDLSDRCPWLPQANKQPGDLGACTDLIVQTSVSTTPEY
jgi:hypothetical protein